jgi:hypothetical protein
MSRDYKATPEQWAHQETWVNQNDADAACILELRARVQALEATQEPTACPHIVSSDEGTSYCRLAEQSQDKLDRLIELDRAEPAPADSLVERVGAAIFKQFESNAGNEAEARAAIREVAAWLRVEDDGLLTFGLDWATRLQREANR